VHIDLVDWFRLWLSRAMLLDEGRRVKILSRTCFKPLCGLCDLGVSVVDACVGTSPQRHKEHKGRTEEQPKLQSVIDLPRSN